MITGTGTGRIARPTTLGNFVDFTKDWTRSQYAKFTSASTGSNYYTVWFASDNAGDNFIELYAWLAGGVGAFSLTLDVKIATTLHSEILSAPVSTATNVYCTIRYTAITHLLEMLIDGVVVDSATLSLASISGIATDIMLNDSGGLASGSIGYDGIWQRAVINSEITAQMSSITVVNSTGLITYCPLQTSIDLTAHNNTLTQFNAAGTVTTDTTDPLLSVVAGPPSNTTPTLATAVTTDSAYFQDVNTAGVATTVWHVCTAPLNAIVMGAIAFGDLVTYKPEVSVYAGLANANANIPLTSIGSGSNLAIQFPVTPGIDYYFKSLRNVVAASTLQLSILVALDLAVPAGSFAINDDAPGLPLALLDRTTGYPIKFVHPFPAGEGGSVLPSGFAAVTDDDDTSGGEFITVVNGITISSSTDATDTGYDAVSDNQNATFYIASGDANSNHGRIISIDTTGVIGTMQWDLPTTIIHGIRALGVNKFPSTIAYYIRNATSSVPIHRFDLVNNIALTDLAVGSGTQTAGKDIIVLSDGTIFILFMGSGNLSLVQYNTDGTIAQTINLGANTHTTDNRIARAIESGHLWVWNRLNSPSGFDEFLRIRISDGATIETVSNTVQYESGLYGGLSGIPTNTPIRFGHSESCPFWVIQSGVTPSNAKSGLYILTGTGGDFGLPDNPILRHDVDWIDTSLGTSESVKIPDPYYDTYLIGDE